MLVLMFDPCFKNMLLVIMYLGQENVDVLVVEYDDELLLPLLIEATKLLMPFNGAKFENLVIQVNYEYLFFTTITNANTCRDLVLRELVGYQVRSQENEPTLTEDSKTVVLFVVIFI